MPLSTSYLENNDYTGLKYSPYQLNVNDIAKTLAIKTAYWNQGAAKVKSRYDSAVNLNLTTNATKATLKDFIQKSEQQIKNLSSQDLSNPDVQEEGVKMFDPLFNNKSIMLDNALTSKKNSIYQAAEAAKNTVNKKTGKMGDGYSDINLQDALDGFEKFNKDTPADEQTLSNLYQTLGGKSYTPYYDYTDDFREGLKDCKGGKAKNDKENGLSIDRTETSGITAFVARQCIESNLNPNALVQIGINARVNYRNNKEALARDASAYLESDIKGTQAALNETEANILAVSKSKNLDKDSKDKYLAQFGARQKEYTNNLEKFNKNLADFKANDYRELDNNYNGWAQRVFKHNLIQGYADPRATYSESHTIESNPGAIAEYTQTNLNQRLQFTTEANKEAAALKYTNDEKLTILKSVLDNKDMTAEDRIAYNLKYGLNLPSQIVQGIDKGTERQEQSLESIHAQLTTNLEKSLNALGDMRSALAGIDDQKLLTAVSNLPANPSQAQYKVVLDLTNSYLDAQKKLLVEAQKKDPNAQLSTQDQKLIGFVNTYRETVNFSNDLNTVLNATEKEFNTTGEGQKLKKEQEEKLNALRKDFIAHSDIRVETRAAIKEGETSFRFGTGNGPKIDPGLIFDVLNGTRTDYKVEFKPGSQPYLINLATKQRTQIAINPDVEMSNAGRTLLKGSGILGSVLTNTIMNPTARNTDAATLFNDINGIKQKYVVGLNKAIGERVYENKVVNGTNASFDASVTKRLQSLNSGAKLEKFKFVTNKFDPTTGTVSFQIITKEKVKDAGVVESITHPESLEDLPKEIKNGSISQVNNDIQFDEKNKTFTMVIPGLAITPGDYNDSGWNLKKEALALKAKQENVPVSEKVFTTFKGKDIYATATPYSGGVEYSFFAKEAATGKTVLLDGYQSISKEGFNGALLTIKKTIN